MTNKTIFENLVGKDFPLTNYKVASYDDLNTVIEKQLLELNNLVFDDNVKYYQRCGNNYTMDNNGFIILFSEIILGNYFDLSPFIDYKKHITQRLKFQISEKNKVVFFDEEFKKLEILYINNPYSESLSPDNYFNEIRTYHFMKSFHSAFIKRNRTLYSKWKATFSKIEFDEILYQDDYPDLIGDSGPSDKSFWFFCRILLKYSALKMTYDDFSNQNKKEDDLNSNRTNREINFYPAVFCTSYGYNLFNYLLTFLQLDKTKTALLSKYFYLFREEKLIEEYAPWSEFFRFLKTEHQITLKKIDDRAQPDLPEFSYLKKVQENFKSDLI